MVARHSIHIPHGTTSVLRISRTIQEPLSGHVSMRLGIPLDQCPSRFTFHILRSHTTKACMGPAVRHSHCWNAIGELHQRNCTVAQCSFGSVGGTKPRNRVVFELWSNRRRGEFTTHARSSTDRGHAHAQHHVGDWYHFNTR